MTMQVSAPHQLHARNSANLMVMLPGALMSSQHMKDAGLLAALDEQRIDLDLMTLDWDGMAFPYEQQLDFIASGVVLPARAHYTSVWLGGISRGGQMALSCLADKQLPVDGLCLLAPYPGSRITRNVIARAGGLDHWQANEIQMLDPEFRVWRWLQRTAFTGATFVGFGQEDRFSDGMSQLARLLPEKGLCVVSGGHDWPTWLSLWRIFLGRGHFSASS